MEAISRLKHEFMLINLIFFSEMACAIFTSLIILQFPHLSKIRVNQFILDQLPTLSINLHQKRVSFVALIAVSYLDPL